MDKTALHIIKGEFKIHLLFLVLLFFCSSHIRAQNYQAKYKVFISKSKIKNISKSDELDNNKKQLYIRLLKNSNPETATLLINDSLAYYYVDDKMQVDSNKNNLVKAAAGNNSEYITINNKLFYNLNLNNKEYWIETNKKKWTIQNENQIVSGYNSRLATFITKGNKLLKVWFTKDIPFHFGPYKYFGLPGLITKVESTLVTFVLIDFKENKNTLEKPVNKIDHNNIITEDEKKALIRRNYPNIFEKY